MLDLVALAEQVVIAHAEPGSKTEALALRNFPRQANDHIL